MATIQLNFTLRTSANCKTAHLLGSWDSYKGQLPLSKDPNKAGGWKGTFRFPNTVLKQGQRYWYYYIIDGWHVSHDPAINFVTEPTTGRKLNVLDIPAGQSGSGTKTTREARHSRRPSNIGVAKGRPLSISEIKSPRPTNPDETRRIRLEQYRLSTMDQLSAQFSHVRVAGGKDSDDDYSDSSDSESGSDVPSLTSRSSGSSTPSSVSSTSSCCTCERYGITRAGARVKLDCRGVRCGRSTNSPEGSDCSSDSDGDYRKGTTRRNGVVMRYSPVRPT